MSTLGEIIRTHPWAEKAKELQAKAAVAKTLKERRFLEGCLMIAQNQAARQKAAQ